MKICERCGTEYETDHRTCANCAGELTPLRELDSYGSYRELRDRSGEERRHRAADRSRADAVLLVPLVVAAGALASVRLSSVFAYVIAVLVAGYGLAGLVSGFWIGGPLVVAASTLLTPPVRRRIGSNLVAGIAFVVLFLIGRASPTAWLF